jgi:hypothetical protein
MQNADLMAQSQNLNLKSGPSSEPGEECSGKRCEKGGHRFEDSL